MSKLSGWTVAGAVIALITYAVVMEFHYFNTPSHEVPAVMRWMPWRWAELAEKCAKRPQPCPPGWPEEKKNP